MYVCINVYKNNQEALNFRVWELWEETEGR